MPTAFVGVREQVLKLVVEQLSVTRSWLSLASSSWISLVDSVKQQNIVYCN